MYLLDQGIFFAILYGNDYVCEKFKNNLKKCYLPSIVAAELYGTVATELYETESDFIESDLKAIEEYIEYFPIAKFDLQASMSYGQMLRKLKRAGEGVSKIDLMIAATAKSLNATVVTHRVKQFAKILAPHQIENWREAPSITVKKSEPGVLYKVATLLKELEINIIHAWMSINIPGYSNANLLKIKINYPTEKIYNQLKLSLEHSKTTYSSINNNQEIEITFELDADRRFNGDSQRNITIKADDQVGLLAEITRPISVKNINIINANCFSNQPGEIWINFTLNGNNVDWNVLRQEIENINVVQEVILRQDSISS